MPSVLGAVQVTSRDWCVSLMTATHTAAEAASTLTSCDRSLAEREREGEGKEREERAGEGERDGGKRG